MNDIQRVKDSLHTQTIELPSWAFGNSGTRFKVFAQPGVPRGPLVKVAGAAQVHRFTGLAPSVPLHIPYSFLVPSNTAYDIVPLLGDGFDGPVNQQIPADLGGALAIRVIEATDPERRHPGGDESDGDRHRDEQHHAGPAGRELGATAGQERPAAVQEQHRAEDR